ncbi:MAG: glycosyltransferase family 4 protein [Lachnospiraceae bacterium]|nr:glycosyltransferase family 4 protein [Lachnospiraceae bacterium]
MKQVFLIGNHDVVIYNFRHEIIERLLQDGYKVGVVLPYGEKVELLKKEGCFFFETKVDRRGTSIWKDAKLFFTYYKLLRQEKPDIILTYTIKPNIYGSLAAGIQKIPCIVNITGLGSAVENEGIMKKISLSLYKLALRNVNYVFFQNQSNRNLFIKRHICVGKHDLLPGSGVNVKRQSLQKYPEGKTKFVFVGRLMREKGIEEYLYAARVMKQNYPDTEFHICGFCEEAYLQKVKELQEKKIVTYHGMVQDMRDIYREMSCIVLPSYHEGMSNVLLEAAATGRPGIASRIPGCEEIIEHGKTGYLFERKSREQLCETIEKFLCLSYEERANMGLAARRKMEKDFDRKIIVNKYMDVIKELEK